MHLTECQDWPTVSGNRQDQERAKWTLFLFIYKFYFKLKQKYSSPDLLHLTVAKLLWSSSHRWELLSSAIYTNTQAYKCYPTLTCFYTSASAWQLAGISTAANQVMGSTSWCSVIFHSVLRLSPKALQGHWMEKLGRLGKWWQEKKGIISDHKTNHLSSQILCEFSKGREHDNFRHSTPLPFGSPDF